MIPDNYRDFFVALVGSDGALVGLLFVAVSLSPRKLREPATAAVAQAEASAALLVFSNVLVLGLLALVPVADIGWATIVLGGLGVLYALATGRVSLARRRTDRHAAWSLLRIALGSLVLCGFEVWAGSEIVRQPASASGFHSLALISTVGLVFGISRAWELIGLPGTSAFRSLRILRDPDDGLPATGPEDAAG